MLQQHNSLGRKIQMKLYHQNLHHKRDQEGYQFFFAEYIIIIIIIIIL